MENRQLLELHISDCSACKVLLYENVALLVAEDEGTLTDAQVVAVLGHLRKQHEGHSMKFNKVSVLIPTRNRTHLLRTLIDSYRATTATDRPSTELLFRADRDDEPTHALLEREGFRMVIGERMHGYASLPDFFNELALAATGDVVMLGNDDIEFVTPDWATLILAAANLYPDGVFNIGVKTHNEGHFPLSLVSTMVVRKLGFIYDPRIFWGDIYLRDVMGRLGRQHLLPEVEIRHQWAGFSPDQTFKEGEAARRAPGNHMEHHVQAVDDAVAKLRELLR